ncbi:Hypothetical predicted protein [Paramuricea clavata]|uniref:Uncharacterized protein n=1 Tax=Paramuricea clavata TaxID=317549 RepID=A0A6S7K9S2_PARCT|nr:Hypothetical predicted protein [Paramuricea clavata]
MAESFMINGLDMQCRFYYAPGTVNHDFCVYELLKGKPGQTYKHGDSSTHVAERVMRSLNECLGNGRSIPIPYDKDTIISSNGETRLLDLTKDELNKFKSERHMDAANECAKRVKERIDGYFNPRIHATRRSSVFLP